MAYLTGLASNIFEFPYNSNYITPGDFDCEMVFRIEGVTLTYSATVGLIGMTAGFNAGNYNCLAGIGWFKGQLQIIHEYGSKNLVTLTTTKLSLGIETWHHIKVSRVGVQYIVYQNNVEIERLSFTDASKPTTTDFSVYRLRFGYISYGNINSLRWDARGSLVYAKVTAVSATASFVFGTLSNPPTKPKMTGIHNYGSPTFEKPMLRQTPRFTGLPVSGFSEYGRFGQRMRRKFTGVEISPKEGSEVSSTEISTPRRYPLETSWKKANPTFFE